MQAGNNAKSLCSLFTACNKDSHPTLELTDQIWVDANKLPRDLWQRLHEHYTEAQIVEAVFVITMYIQVSKFGDALGVVLEPAFKGIDPILNLEHD